MKPVTTIGLDISTKATGYTVFHDQNLIAKGTLSPGNINLYPRMKYMKTCVQALVEAHDPNFVVIEDYLHSLKYGKSSQTKALTTLAELGGMCKEAITEHSQAEIIIYSIPDIKRLAAGKGNASKKDMQDSLPKGYTYQVPRTIKDTIIFNTPDEVDSFWVSYMFFQSNRYKAFYKFIGANHDK